MTPIPDQWYVQFDGRVYGPFPYAQMQDFVNEGRVIASSKITTDPDRGFFDASAFPVFSQWTATQQQPPRATRQKPQAQPQPQSERPSSNYDDSLVLTEQASDHYTQPSAHANNMGNHLGHTARPLSNKPRVMLVMAEIRSGNDMRFLHAMQSQGTAQRIGDNVWLLKAQMDVEQLCQILSQTLSKQDRLFLLDSFNNKTSWFNIGADMDTRIRELWSQN